MLCKKCAPNYIDLRRCEKCGEYLKTNDSTAEIPLQIRHKLEDILNYYNDKLINHRSDMIPLIDQAVNDYEKNVKYLKNLLGLGAV